MTTRAPSDRRGALDDYAPYLSLSDTTFEIPVMDGLMLLANEPLRLPARRGSRWAAWSFFDVFRPSPLPGRPCPEAGLLIDDLRAE